MNSRTGVAALITAAACWGSAVVTVTLAARSLTTIGITLIEVTAAAVALGLALLARRTALPRPTLLLFVAGLLEPGSAYLLINAGVARTSATHAALLIGTESVFVVLALALVTRRPPRPQAVAGLVVCVTGTALLADGGGGAATVLGDALVLLGVLAATGYVVVATRLSTALDPLALTGYQFLFGWLAMLPIVGAVVITDGGSFVGRPALPDVLAAALTGLLGSALAFFLYNWALSRVSASLAGASLALIPVFGVAFSVLLLDEPITPRTAAAGIAVLAGIVLTQAGRLRTRPGHPVRPADR